MKYRVLHVVRRFGPVGGMEKYVWRLTSELLELGVEIDILCQSVECDVDPRITIHLLESSTDRRRWKAMRDFRNKCNQFWLAFNAKDDVIVHSHERCNFHHITTFHGPPIGDHFKCAPWWKRIQPRLKAWAQFEEIELCSSGVKAVVPVSSIVEDVLQAIYPDISSRIRKPAWPGVDPCLVRENEGRGYRLVFVGREWHRKGLDVALAAYSQARKCIPMLTLDVFGVSASDLPKFMSRNFSEVSFHGWETKIPFEKYDVLIHPARVEPFGMIVPEARAAGLSVIVSDRVGATDLPLSGIKIVDSCASQAEWSAAVQEVFESPRPESEICWTWRQLAEWHLNNLYSGC